MIACNELLATNLPVCHSCLLDAFCFSKDGFFFHLEVVLKRYLTKLLSTDMLSIHFYYLASGRGLDRIVFCRVFVRSAYVGALLICHFLGLMLAGFQVKSRLASSSCSVCWRYDDDKMSILGQHDPRWCKMMQDKHEKLNFLISQLPHLRDLTRLSG